MILNTTSDKLPQIEIYASHRNGEPCLQFIAYNKQGDRFEDYIPLSFIFQFSRYTLNALTRDSR